MNIYINLIRESNLFHSSIRSFKRFFTRTVTVAPPTVEGLASLHFPLDIWSYKIIPNLSNRRDLLVFSCCSRATYAISQEAISTIVDFNKSKFNKGSLTEILEAAEEKNQS